MLRGLTGVVALSAVAWMPPVAMAQQDAQECLPPDVAAAMLAEQYGEKPLLAGLSANRYILRFFANPQTGTWTVMAADPNGCSRMLDSGVRFNGAAGGEQPAEAAPGETST